MVYILEEKEYPTKIYITHNKSNYKKILRLKKNLEIIQ